MSKCLKSPIGEKKSIEYNNGGYVNGGFYKEEAEGEDRMLFAKFMLVGLDLGMAPGECLKMAGFLGNRRCLGCGDGKRGDVVRGTMHCALHKAPGTIEEHLKEWAMRPFDKKCYNFEMA